MKDLNPKNFFTKFLSMKTIKDLIRTADYITDRNDTHLNHSSENHKTIVLDSQADIDKKLKNIMNIFNFHTTRIKLNRAGGKPSSPATSIMISLPDTIDNKKLSMEDMKQLHSAMLIDIVSKMNEIYKLNLTKAEEKLFIKMYVVSSIHYKDNNPHINIILPSVVETFKTINRNNETKRVRENIVKIRLGLRKFSYHTKLLVEKNMFNLGYSLSDYVIKKQRNNTKQNPIASIRQDIKEERNKQLQITNELQEKNKQSILEMQQLQQIFKEMEFLKGISKQLQKRIEVYLNRMNTALQEDDMEKYKKNEALVTKSYNKLSELVDVENKEKLSKFEELKKSIEEKRKNKSDNYPSPTIK